MIATKKSKSPKQTVKEKSEIILFGKHKGEPFWHILKTDPQYILWLDNEELVDMPEEWIEDAEEPAERQHRQYLRDNYDEAWGQDNWGNRD